MNDATLWNSGKTAGRACYSVPFIHIQGTVFNSWRDFEVYLSVLFFPHHYDVHQCLRTKAGSSAPQKTIRSYTFTRQRLFD